MILRQRWIRKNVPDWRIKDDYTMITCEYSGCREEEKKWCETDTALGFLLLIRSSLLLFGADEYLKTIVDGLVSNFYTFMKSKICISRFFTIMQHCSLYYLRVIDQRANQVEDLLHETYENKDFLYDLEKCLVYFTTALKSNEVVLEKLRKHIG